MSHKPIVIKNLSLYFPHKSCFENFSQQIHPGNRIAVIGRNGSGKSTLLKIIQGLQDSTEGNVHIPDGVTFGYVPQMIEDNRNASGSQRFNHALTKALALTPTILCLDEPTNHLDARNRQSLMRMLQSFHGTLIIVSHDVELLRTCINEIWDINAGAIHRFTGNYDDYMQEREFSYKSILDQREKLTKDIKKAQKALNFEQKRATKSKQANAHENDRKLKGFLKNKGSQTIGKNRGNLNALKQDLTSEYQKNRLPEVIQPKFHLTTPHHGTKTLISITNGSCGYTQPILQNITLTIGAQGRIAITGDNGSGKSTFIKAILQNSSVLRSGKWHTPETHDIGYLDQHYATLPAEKSLLELIQEATTNWIYADIRRHLNNFLFRKNEEVVAKIKTLSGGEKARASLALIAAKTPKLLILDEVTNNLDLQTREHVIDVIKEYPGALIVISHDQDFLNLIKIDTFYHICSKGLLPGLKARGFRPCT